MGCLRVPLNPKPRENEDSEGIPGVPTENFSGITDNDTTFPANPRPKTLNPVQPIRIVSIFFSSIPI